MKLIFGTVSILLLGQMSFAQDWPTYLGGPERTGRSTATIDPNQVSLRWRGPRTSFNPKIVGDRIYALDQDLNPPSLRCYDARTGNVIWRQNLQLGSLGEPTVFGNFVAMTSGTINGRLSVFNAATGQPVASASMAGAPSTAPLVRQTGSNQFEFFVPSESILTKFVLDGTRLTRQWTSQMAIGANSSLSLLDDTVVVYGNGSASVVNAGTGQSRVFSNVLQPLSGSSSVTIDSQNKRMFLRGTATTIGTSAIRAYQFQSFNAISEIWSNTISLSSNTGSTPPTLLQGGDVLYIANGKVIRASGLFGTIVAESSDLGAIPQAIFASEGVAWVATPTGVQALDLASLTHIRTISTDRLWTAGSGETSLVAATDRWLVTTSNGPNSLFANGIAVYAVPEPSILATLGLGLLGLSKRRRKQVGRD